MGHVSPDRIVEPKILELRNKKKVRLRELRGHDRLLSIVRARQYRSELEQSRKEIQRNVAEEAEEQRLEELRQVCMHACMGPAIWPPFLMKCSSFMPEHNLSILQVQDQIKHQLSGIGRAQQDAAEFAAEAERAAKEREIRIAELEVSQRRRSHAVGKIICY